MARSSVSASRPLSSWNGSVVCARSFQRSNLRPGQAHRPHRVLAMRWAHVRAMSFPVEAATGGQDGRRTAGTASTRFRSHSVSVLTALHFTTSDISVRGSLYRKTASLGQSPATFKLESAELRRSSSKWWSPCTLLGPPTDLHSVPLHSCRLRSCRSDRRASRQQCIVESGRT